MHVLIKQVPNISCSSAEAAASAKHLQPEMMRSPRVRVKLHLHTIYCDLSINWKSSIYASCSEIAPFIPCGVMRQTHVNLSTCTALLPCLLFAPVLVLGLHTLYPMIPSRKGLFLYLTIIRRQLCRPNHTGRKSWQH